MSHFTAHGARGATGARYPSLESKRRIIPRFFTILLATSWLVAGCGEFEKEILISRQTVQQSVDKYFPYEQNALLARLKLHSPSIYFRGRGVGVKLSYEAFVLNKELTGVVDFNGELVYRPESGAFYLTNIRMEEISANQSKLSDNKTLRAYAENFVSQKLSEQPVYVLKADDTKQQLAKLLLKDIRVKGDNLAVVLSLKK